MSFGSILALTAKENQSGFLVLIERHFIDRLVYQWEEMLLGGQQLSLFTKFAGIPCAPQQ